MGAGRYGFSLLKAWFHISFKSLPIPEKIKLAIQRVEKLSNCIPTH
jgi:hypothetical protein